MRKRDLVYSTARIFLPIAVKPDFERVLLGWEGPRQIVLFLTLCAPERNFKKEDDLLVVQMSRTHTNSKEIDVDVGSTISKK